MVVVCSVMAMPVQRPHQIFFKPMGMPVRRDHFGMFLNGLNDRGGMG